MSASGTADFLLCAVAHLVAEEPRHAEGPVSTLACHAPVGMPSPGSGPRG